MRPNNNDATATNPHMLPITIAKGKEAADAVAEYLSAVMVWCEFESG
jgi:hypothetical protein